MLVQTRNYLAAHGEDPRNLSLFGQEMNLNTWAICKMNLFLHDIDDAQIARGDTLRDPKHLTPSSKLVYCPESPCHYRESGVVFRHGETSQAAEGVE
jgi:type I restriction-modification system DNA methylase subunit